MNIVPDILNAEVRIKTHILRTPLNYSHHLSQLVKGKVYLKMESEQLTGSFKARGALNKLMYLQEEGHKGGVLTASTGNHGLGVARACKKLRIKGTVIIPENTSPVKVQALESYGIAIEKYGNDCFESEVYARKLAEEKGMVYISPYNDRQVIGGQGTIGIELLEQSRYAIDNVFVTVGGGGLISGLGSFLKFIHPEITLFSCQPENSPEMTLSVQNNEYQTVELKDTLSDGSAGAFEEDSMTYPICKNIIDEFVLASEQEIADGINLILNKERKLIEGAAAVAVASLIKRKEMCEGKNSVIIICGGNISTDRLKTVL